VDVAASRDIANSVEMVAVPVSNRLRPAIAHGVQVDHAPVRRRLVKLVEQFVIRQRPRLDDDVVEGTVRHGAVCMLRNVAMILLSRVSAPTSS